MAARTINGQLALFSAPVDKKEIINRLITVCYDTNEKIRNALLDYMLQYSDSKLVKYWNRKMNVNISVFAPNMFVFQYSNEIVMS